MITSNITELATNEAIFNVVAWGHHAEGLTLVAARVRHEQIKTHTKHAYTGGNSNKNRLSELGMWTVT